jgi:hypothetical protein
MKKILLFGIVLISVISAQAQLAVWNYTSSQDPSAITVDPNATASVFAISSGVVQYKAASPTTFYGSGWPTSSIFSSTEKYFEVSLSPKSGYKLTVTGISFNAGRTATGPNKIDAYYSTDNFAGSTLVGSYTNNNESTLTPFSGAAMTLTVNEGETLKIRFWGYEGGGGAFRINNISIAGASSTLPISLTSFTAKPIDKTILLNWATASEKNNQKFEVLKSVDGKSFKSIATVNGTGNSDTDKSYSFADENPYAGANYYKLKQTDFDGATATSTVISANAKIEDVKLSAYVSSNSVIVNINSPNQTDGKITLFDMNGRKLESKNLVLNKGYNEINFGKFIVPGTYFVNLMSGGKSISYKFIK